MLAKELEADCLLMLTDVDAVYADWGKPGAKPLRQTTPAHLRSMTFEPGTMAPKVKAACRFVEQTGGEAAIGALSEIDAILNGEAGTAVQPAID